MNLDRYRNPSIFRTQSSLLSGDIHVVHQIAQPYVELQVAHRYHASFDMFYSLQILLSHGFISKYAITDELLRLLCHGNEQHSLMALEALFQRRRRISNLVTEVRELLPDDPDWFVPSTKVIPNGCVMIRKVIVTPTRILFMPPTVSFCRSLCCFTYKPHPIFSSRLKWEIEYCESITHTPIAFFASILQRRISGVEWTE